MTILRPEEILKFLTAVGFEKQPIRNCWKGSHKRHIIFESFYRTRLSFETQ